MSILAATTAGLVAVSLDTLNTTTISTPTVYAVAFDTKTGKVIWSEDGSIKRAYANGTESEILKTGTSKAKPVLNHCSDKELYFITLFFGVFRDRLRHRN